MGIKDLLAAVTPAVQNLDISEFRGQRICIDASGWLHKGLFGCAEDIVDSMVGGVIIDHQLYIDFILSRVRHMLCQGVEPVLVFDGRRSILKTETQEKRSESRRGQLEQGRRLLDNMAKVSDEACKSKFRAEAISNFQRGMSVTAEMESNTIGALRHMGVKVIVSPYEADAQLAYLCHTGYCQAVLTEDSDILVYSAVCGTPFNILYKFEKTGSVQCVNMLSLMPGMAGAGAGAGTGATAREQDDDASSCSSSLSALSAPDLCNDAPPFSSGGIHSSSSSSRSGIGSGSGNGSGNAPTAANKNSKTSSQSQASPRNKMKGFLNLLKTQFWGAQGRRMFVQMCVLAGCDYSESCTGVGLVTALQAVVRCRDGPDDSRIDRVTSLFRLKKIVPENYLARAKKAEALFHYHPVFDIDLRGVLPFSPPRYVAFSPDDGPAHSAAESDGHVSPQQAPHKQAPSNSVAAVKSASKRGNPANYSAQHVEEIDSCSDDEDEQEQEGSFSSQAFASSSQGSLDSTGSGSMLSSRLSRLSGGSSAGRSHSEELTAAAAAAVAAASSEFFPPSTTLLDQVQMGGVCASGGQQLLRLAPSHTTLADMCLGLVSCKDFSVIACRYPWEIPGFDRPSKHAPGSGSSYWNVRRTLMHTNQLHRATGGLRGMASSVSVNSGIRKMDLPTKRGLGPVNVDAGDPAETSHAGKEVSRIPATQSFFGDSVGMSGLSRGGGRSITDSFRPSATAMAVSTAVKRFNTVSGRPDSGAGVAPPPVRQSMYGASGGHAQYEEAPKAGAGVKAKIKTEAEFGDYSYPSSSSYNHSAVVDLTDSSQQCSSSSLYLSEGMGAGNDAAMSIYISDDESRSIAFEPAAAVATDVSPAAADVTSIHVVSSATPLSETPAKGGPPRRADSSSMDDSADVAALFETPSTAASSKSSASSVSTVPTPEIPADRYGFVPSVCWSANTVEGKIPSQALVPDAKQQLFNPFKRDATRAVVASPSPSASPGSQEPEREQEQEQSANDSEGEGKGDGDDDLSASASASTSFLPPNENALRGPRPTGDGEGGGAVPPYRAVAYHALSLSPRAKDSGSSGGSSGGSRAYSISPSPSHSVAAAPPVIVDLTSCSDQHTVVRNSGSVFAKEKENVVNRGVKRPADVVMVAAKAPKSSGGGRKDTNHAGSSASRGAVRSSGSGSNSGTGGTGGGSGSGSGSAAKNHSMMSITSFFSAVGTVRRDGGK